MKRVQVLTLEVWKVEGCHIHIWKCDSGLAVEAGHRLNLSLSRFISSLVYDKCERGEIAY